ncbi:Acid phosphatase [Pleurostoma richardsiae]|uniref:3-phytase n=1 Tax=Pleurostoma richardsiae TaxID=41990 RepID=A0AA38RLL9_9PEZI|nr:Acid phosphatase [Pleurostoma richardsiae]
MKAKQAAGYELVGEQADAASPVVLGAHTPSLQRRAYRMILVALITCMVICLAINFSLDSGFAARLTGPGSNNDCRCRDDPPDVPQYFQTSPQMWAGPTATGKAAFLAQTVAFDPSRTYVPNAPLQTAVPIEGMTAEDASIFQMMGYLSPYSPAPGFGVDEWPLPEGAEIVQVQMLSRHGSRYPTEGTNVEAFGKRIVEASGEFKAKGALEFLNGWEYQMGSNILVPNGRMELFNSGILHSYNYGSLYNTNSKIIVRTTTQDRMLKSAEYFLAGFFGLEWTRNATIEVIIEHDGFNNSLAGSKNCPNADKEDAGTKANQIWYRTYLQNATERLKDMVEGYEWTVEDTYAAQNLCPYETVAYGFSRFCDLFTYEEWIGFSYSIDLAFSGNNGFQSQTARAVGLGWQQEFIARLKNHTLGYSGSQINVTLDSSTETFPLNQSLYFDFSHDTNIVSALTAMGLTQFADPLPADKYPGRHDFTVSHVVPFGARLDVEVVRTPKPLAADRSGYAAEGGETRYVHFVLNQRTLPLGRSFPECDASRVDGWCELETFLRVQERMPELAKYEEACHGELKEHAYGEATDGAPL